jgi:hypothetical protein
MNYSDLAITGSFWTVGIILARLRRLSLRGQIRFTVIMWGSMLLGLLLPERRIPGIEKLPGGALLASIGLVILIATFFRKQFFTPQILAAFAVLLMLSTFAIRDYVAAYTMYAIVGVLLLASAIVALKGRKPPEE